MCSPPPLTNADLELFLQVGPDTRRSVQRALGLPKRTRYAWSEVWAALDLDPQQPEAIWPELTLGPPPDPKNPEPTRRHTLWTPARVADELGMATDTIHEWCRRRAPEDFPRPILDVGPRTRRWLPLQVRAYMQPSIYARRAALIRTKLVRSKPTRRASSPPPQTSPSLRHHGTLQPLPLRPDGAAG